MVKLNSFFFGFLTYLIFSSSFSFAQQLPITNHYIFNSFALNPALGGARPFYEIKTNHRNQWVGLQDAPRTYLLSFNGPLLSNMGVGGLVFSDNIGPINTTGLQGSYAYHIKLRKGMNLSFGLGFGFLHYSLDVQKLIIQDKNDEIITGSVQSVFLPDAKFGAYFTMKNLFAGISVPQLLQSKINLPESKKSVISRLKSHYYLFAGYKYDINSKFSVEPSFLFKYINPIIPQLDLTGRVIYENKVWIAGSYRTDDAVAVMLGYNHKDLFSIGYSYDFTFSNLKNYSQGSHEIMIGVKLARNKKKKEDDFDSIEESSPKEIDPIQ